MSSTHRWALNSAYMFPANSNGACCSCEAYSGTYRFAPSGTPKSTLSTSDVFTSTTNCGDNNNPGIFYKSTGPPSPPACGSGSHSWYLSAWQGNCDSACSAQGKTCIAQPTASRNANCVLALAVDNGFSCSNNRPGSWSGNPSIATLSGSGSCWYNSGTSSSSTFCSASSPSYHRFCPCT